MTGARVAVSTVLLVVAAFASSPARAARLVASVSSSAGAVSSRVISVNPDGSDLRTIIDLGQIRLDRIDVDAEFNRLYWIERGSISSVRYDVRRALGGGGCATLFESPNLVFGEPGAIAIDPETTLYWGQARFGPTQRRFYSAEPDGNNAGVAYEGGSETLELDRVNGKAYWVERIGTSTFVRRGDFDFDNVQNVVSLPLNFQDVFVDVFPEPFSGKLYWIQRPLAPGEFWRSNLNGNNRQALFVVGDAVAFVFDRSVEKLVWANDNKIFRANLDGTDQETLVTLGPSESVTDLVIVDGALGPYGCSLSVPAAGKPVIAVLALALLVLGSSLIARRG